MDVLVLMSCFNGEAYLVEQIESILAQQGVSVRLLVRDDGSTDATAEILQDYQDKGFLEWYQGDNLKSAQSFMDLLQTASGAHYYAFADQDDVWYPHKLQAAVTCLSGCNDQPTLYFSHKRVVDRELKPLGIEDEAVNGLELGTSLLKCRVSGCTMVFNDALLRQLQTYRPYRISMHDSWVLKVASAIGTVVEDKGLFMDYRQHERNVVGSRKSAFDVFKIRVRSLFSRSKDSIRTSMAQQLMEGYGSKMSAYDQQYCQAFAEIRSSFKARLRLVFSSYLKPHNRKETLAIKVLVLLGWM